MNNRMFGDRKPYFFGVAIATILVGSAILAMSLAELASNLWLDGTFSQPSIKLIGGLLVISLGYIHMELEAIRITEPVKR